MMGKSMVKKVAKIGVAAGLVLSTSMAMPSTNAQTQFKQDYLCAQLHGVWTTWARTPLGLSPLVRWKTTVNKQWTPRNRCIAVSRRFQILSGYRVLNHFVGGVVNKEPVLCGVSQIGDECNSRNVILTLKRTQDPDFAAEKLLDLQARARGDVLTLRGNKCFPDLTEYQDYLAENKNTNSDNIKTCVNKKVYYDWENALNAIAEHEKKNGNVVTDESTLIPVR